tara:strand:+ start:147 stop:548 length:402 start_codon:yes stop_codon:yes gene_type:complete
MENDMSEAKRIFVQFDGYTESLDADDVHSFFATLMRKEYVSFENCKRFVEGNPEACDDAIPKAIFINALRVLNLKGDNPDESYVHYLQDEIREFEFQYHTDKKKNIEDDPSDRYDSQMEGEDYTEYLERMNHG